VTGGRRYRLLFVALVSVGVWIAGWATGFTDQFTQENIRNLLARRGVPGMLAFGGVFAVAQLLRVPSPVFIAAAVAVYGKDTGAVIALLGALTSATVSFTAVRSLAGHALADVAHPLIRRSLRHLDHHPIMTVALLRLIFQTAPPLNYALAMTAIHWRNHLWGSMLGLPLPVVAMAWFFDRLLKGRTL
jgi:uncharacterized membrane protein YdjX (TVP38/TMEM64 family)